MAIQTKRLPALALLVFGAGCPEPAPADPLAPEPVGAELLRVEGTGSFAACASSSLYRRDREIQHQCFDDAGVFSWENRATLTTQASAKLDQDLANAAPDDTAPVNYMGSCGNPDAVGTITIWVDERSVSFEPFCLTEGTLELYQTLAAIRTEISNCEGPFETIESVDDGCRAY